MGKLSEAELEQRMAGAPAWTREGESIERELKLEDFAAAVAMVNSIAELAEAANHHPDLLLHGWNRLRIALSTHSEGGLTDADFALARKLDELV